MKSTHKWTENVSDGDVVMMVEDCKEKLEMEERVLVPKGVYITCEDLEVFGFTARCPGCVSLLKGAARQAHTANCRRRIEEEPRGTLKAEAANMRAKDNQDKAAERRTDGCANKHKHKHKHKHKNWNTVAILARGRGHLWPGLEPTAVMSSRRAAQHVGPDAFVAQHVRTCCAEDVCSPTRRCSAAMTLSQL